MASRGVGDELETAVDLDGDLQGGQYRSVCHKIIF